MAKKKAIAKPKLKKYPKKPKTPKQPKANAPLAVWQKYNATLAKKAKDYTDKCKVIDAENKEKEKKYNKAVSDAATAAKNKDKAKTESTKLKGVLSGLGKK